MSAVVLNFQLGAQGSHRPSQILPGWTMAPSVCDTNSFLLYFCTVKEASLSASCTGDHIKRFLHVQHMCWSCYRLWVNSKLYSIGGLEYLSCIHSFSVAVLKCWVQDMPNVSMICQMEHFFVARMWTFILLYYSLYLPPYYFLRCCVHAASGYKGCSYLWSVSCLNGKFPMFDIFFYKHFISPML